MTGSLLEFVLLVLSALTALALIVTGLMVLNSELRMVRRLQDMGEPASHEMAMGMSEQPFGLAAVLVAPGKDREEVEQYLQAAGYRDPRALLLFGVVRLGTVGVLALAGFILFKQIAPPGPAPLLAALVGACVGYLAPKQILRMNTTRRLRKITAELPFTLDILIMMLESGISIDQSFRTFAQSEGRAAPMVQETVAALVRDLDIGTPYDVALSRWSQRLGVAGGQELAAVIQQALTHGTPLAQVLKEFSKEYAGKRVGAAREAVNKKSVKMTIVMLIFIMPALMLVLVGPAVVSLGRTFQQITR